MPAASVTAASANASRQVAPLADVALRSQVAVEKSFGKRTTMNNVRAHVSNPLRLVAEFRNHSEDWQFNPRAGENPMEGSANEKDRTLFDALADGTFRSCRSYPRQCLPLVAS